MPGMRRELGLTGRIVSWALAMIWLAAGTAAFLLGLERRYWLAVALGPAAFLYGLVWLHMARTGRRVEWPRGGS